MQSSLSDILHYSRSTRPRTRPPGRPRKAEEPARRRLHIGAAFCRFVLGESPEAIAARYGVSSKTLLDWSNRAMEYEDLEAVALRRIVEAFDSGELAGSIGSVRG